MTSPLAQLSAQFPGLETSFISQILEHTDVDEAILILTGATDETRGTVPQPGGARRPGSSSPGPRPGSSSIGNRPGTSTASRPANSNMDSKSPSIPSSSNNFSSLRPGSALLRPGSASLRPSTSNSNRSNGGTGSNGRPMTAGRKKQSLAEEDDKVAR